MTLQLCGDRRRRGAGGDQRHARHHPGQRLRRLSTPVTLAAIAEDSGARLITQAQLLANATDVDGPSLTAINLAISSGNGTLVDNGNGTWSYTPALNDDTSVTFSYAVTDGVAAPVATSATLDITPVNDAPISDAGDPGGDCRGQRGAADHAGPTLANATDVDGPVADGDQSGDLVRQRHAGRQRQRHLELYAGAQRRHLGDFSYAVTDGVAAPVATTATLDITPVNDAPVTTPVTLAAIAEDSGARLITQAELLANATDVDGPSLTRDQSGDRVRQRHAGGTTATAPGAIRRRSTTTPR